MKTTLDAYEDFAAARAELRRAVEATMMGRMVNRALRALTNLVQS